VAYHHGDLREALLTAAESLLVAGGPAGVTLRACARLAGVSHAAPQHHFRNMADLLAEVAARGFDRLSVRLQEALERAGHDPEAGYLAIARTYVGFARSDAALFRLMFRSDVLNAENAALLTASRRTYAAMVDIIARLRGDPPVNFDDLQRRIQDPGLKEDILISWSHIHGFAQLLLEGQLGTFLGAGESVDDFVERKLSQTAARLSGLLRRSGS
jgi:AcrR family transcriptional regulator